MPIFQTKISACIWISDPDFFSCYHWSGVWKYCNIRVSLSLINQESAMVYVIFSLAMKWHKIVFGAKGFSGKQKKGESWWGNTEWSLSLKVRIIESKFSYGKSAMDLKAEFNWNKGAHGNLKNAFERNYVLSWTSDMTSKQLWPFKHQWPEIPHIHKPDTYVPLRMLACCDPPHFCPESWCSIP